MLQLHFQRSGLRFRSASLPKTARWRKTEPDSRQAFYMSYECGSQVISPDLKQERVVGKMRFVFTDTSSLFA